MTAAIPTHPEDALSDPEHDLLADELGGKSVRLLLRSKTRIDTGSWLRKTPLWVCVTDSEIVLLAASKRRYLQRATLSECGGTEYCHTSGALLLQPDDHWRFNTIALSPTDGLKVLQSLRTTPETQSSPVTEPNGA